MVEDLDPEQLRKSSEESVNKLCSLMNDMKIVPEYEDAFKKNEDQVPRTIERHADG